VLSEIKFESLCQFASSQHDASSTAFTFKPNVRAEARDDPFIRAAGMLFSKLEMIVQLKIWKHDSFRNPYSVFSGQWSENNVQLSDDPCKHYKLNYDKLRTQNPPMKLLPLSNGTTIIKRGIMSNEYYSVEIAGLKRDLRLFQIKPGLKIAILNILGDTELVQACAKELARKLENVQYDVLVTAEAKSIPLAYAVSVETKKPYVVLRKAYKPYMGKAITAETLSITTGQPQTLILDEKDIELMKGRKVVVVDDVISTGSTLQGMRAILEKAGSIIAAETAIFTEGDSAQWANIISLGHLPLFIE
jgi:adenine phosphoribosyltransferase